MSGGFRNQILPRLVIGGTGNGTGFFEYNGTPKNGNPPIAYAVPPGVTKDPFGNTLGLTGGFVAVSGSLAAQLAAGLLKFSSTVSLPFTTPEVQSLAAAAAGTQINVISGKGTAGAIGVTATFYDSLNSPQGVAQVVIGPVLNPVAPSTTALLEVQGAIQTTALASIIANGNLQSQLGDIIASAGNLLINTIGKGLRVKEGSGGKQGTILLSAGTAVVTNSNVTAASRIFLTAQDNLSTGALRVSARTAGTSFTITSSNAADSGVVAWEIFEPA